MTEDPAPAAHPKRASSPLIAGVLLLAAVVGGYAVYSRSAAPPSRPQAGEILLEDAIILGSPGPSRRIRVKDPCTVEFRVAPPAGASVDVSFGVPGPAEASPTDAPDPATAMHWTVTAGDAPRRQVVSAPGLYVVTIDSSAGSSHAGQSVSVTLRALPPR